MHKFSITRMFSFALLSVAALFVCAALAFYYSPEIESSLGYDRTRKALSDYTKVDLNTADSAALSTLPGIGEKRAQAIISYRSKNGFFHKVEDVVQVPGITKSIVDSWGRQAYVGKVDNLRIKERKL